MNDQPINIFWFRRDLRLDDNMALSRALHDDLPVLAIFIFDTNILNSLHAKTDARVTFIHNQLTAINKALKEKGSALIVKHGKPKECWKQLCTAYQIKKVYTNNDYEPYARKRDRQVKQFLKTRGISFQIYKDHVIFEPNEIVKDNVTPYVVFTPYSKRWGSALTKERLQQNTSALSFQNWLNHPFERIIGLEELGFIKSKIEFPSKNISDPTFKSYGEQRDYPAMEGTSRLGIHLRFGTISIRKLASESRVKSPTYLNELIWREFYQMILWHFPRVVEENFKTQYNQLQWRNNEAEFNAWCKGKTGYPIVDAGMRELNETGYMHNRVRMIVASFLTKHLLVDWRWGEAYFAEKLLDYELASNNGGWQWAAGTGTDAQPYFRIFNPELQTKKFDPELKYIKKWVPEFQELNYPKPIVEHKIARKRALKAYKEVLRK